MREHWSLDPEVVFLNHGSFGACPTRILELQQELRTQLERHPVDFLAFQAPRLLDQARQACADFVGARPQNFVFVPNATTGVNAVLRSFPFRCGDGLLVTDHGYPACRNLVDYVANRYRLEIQLAQVPFPLASPDQVVEAVLAATGPSTRLALLDHVTSPTGLVFPVQELTEALSERGVTVFVDGAHGPGMLELQLEQWKGLGYYTGNFHKWCCAPKGAAFLWVCPGLQSDCQPAVISHGYRPRPGRSAFCEGFDWGPTFDPTAWLCVPEALTHLADLSGGWPALRRGCRELLLEGRNLVATALGVRPPAPDSMIGLLATLPLPAGRLGDPLRDFDLKIQEWPEGGDRWLRLSAFLYNGRVDYQRLASLFT